MELTYTKHGDYYLPDLTLPDENYEIGRFGKAHRKYLREHHKGIYEGLVLSGKLPGYLHDLDNTCAATFEQLTKELAQKENVTERLKADNQMEWVRRMNSIRNRAEEIVFFEYVYV